MTILWVNLLVFLGGGGTLIVLAILLVRRSERRLGGGPDGSTPDIAGRTGDAEVAAYLDRMTSELKLPAADVSEVRAEVADHLEDSIASLQAEGLDAELAVREALGRLGPAAELGRQLRAAHQSTRRLLAGVGGGVFAAGGGFVLGYLGSIMLATLLLIPIALAGALLSRIGIPLPDVMRDHGDSVNSVLYAAGTAFGAGVATRYAVRTSAGLSRRSLRSIAPIWAAVGAVGFGWWALFGMRGAQSWPGIAAEALIPVAAVLAALVRIERPMPHVGRWAVSVGLVTVVSIVVSLALITGAASGVYGSSSGQSGQPDMHFDTVAPMAPAAWLPNDYGFGESYGNESQTSGTWVTAELAGSSAPPVASVLAKWTDLRFEAWHARDDFPATYGIDPGYSSPFATEPAADYGTYLAARFHFERLRDAGYYWVVLTGVGPDGHRYRLSDGTGGGSSFYGSAWDWLTAPQ